MRINRKKEFSIGNLMNLECFIVGPRENKLAVSRYRDGSHSSRVLLDDLRLSLHRIVPQTYGSICRAGSDQLSWCRHFDIVDLRLMANESEGAHGSLEVPDHHCAVSGTGYYLL